MGADASKLLEEYLESAGAQVMFAGMGPSCDKEFDKEQEDLARKIFATLDSDDNHFIDGEEVHDLLVTMMEVYQQVAKGSKLTLQEAKHIFETSDCNHDGKLTKREFVVLLEQYAQHMTKEMFSLYNQDKKDQR